MKFILIFSLLFLSGCNSIFSQPAEKVQIYVNPPMVSKPIIDELNFHILISEKDKIDTYPLISFDFNNYKILQKNILELKRYTLELESVIEFYKKINEPKVLDK